MRTARLEARQRVARDLPVACEVYAVDAWLETAPVERLLRDLMTCVLAADCWRIEMPTPRRSLDGAAWTRYLATRLAAAPPFLAQSLARWAVLERIPVRWIPAHKVSAQIGASIAAAGMRGNVTELTLVPPVTGGSEWVGRDCPGAADVLAELARDRPVAAILHWPTRTAAAIVTSAHDGLRAFGTAFGAEGLAFAPGDLAGSVVVPPAAPPLSRSYRTLRALGLQPLAWRLVRRWRTWRGVNPLAAV